MMHVRFSLITADPQVVSGCIQYIEDEGRGVVESQRDSLGLALLASPEPRVAILETFWATEGALLHSEPTQAPLLSELARRVNAPVTAEDYEVAVFEGEELLRSGQAVRLTRLQVKPSGVDDVIEVFGDTAVPSLTVSPGFGGALLFAGQASGQLISQTMWQDQSARSASPSVAKMIGPDVLQQEDYEVRSVEDYSLVFTSVFKPEL
jgi:hypothetical protein